MVLPKKAAHEPGWETVEGAAGGAVWVVEKEGAKVSGRATDVAAGAIAEVGLDGGGCAPVSLSACGGKPVASESDSLEH